MLQATLLEERFGWKMIEVIPIDRGRYEKLKGNDTDGNYNTLWSWLNLLIEMNLPKLLIASWMNTSILGEMRCQRIIQTGLIAIANGKESYDILMDDVTERKF